MQTVGVRRVLARRPARSERVESMATEGDTQGMPSTSDQQPGGGAIPSIDLRGRRLVRGRFEVRRPLGAGGMGSVYEAHDHERDLRVALKTLNRLSPAGVYRIKNEFRSLVDVRHPNLVPLLELFCDDDIWFFTMELVRGRNFTDHARLQLASEGHEPGPEAYNNVMACFAQLVRGVSAIHQAGKLHRDIKPSNVLVTQSERVVVLDFGLVSDVESGGVGQTVGTSIVGTPQYIAPEQLLGGVASAASDMYALGVVLYEALTGTLPRYSEAERSRWPGAARPLPPAAIVPSVPDPCSAMCLRLLASDPEERMTLPELLQAVEPYSSDAHKPPRGSLGPVAEHFLGREAELGRLTRALDDAERGQGVVVMVRGPSGIGKSRLLDEFARRAQQSHGSVVLRGRCYERESVPFKTLDSAVDSLSRHWRGMSTSQGAALLPRNSQALIRLFPVLERVDVLRNAPGLSRVAEDPREQRVRGFRALKEVLARMGDRCSLVLMIDDLQWADTEGLRELSALVTGADAPTLLLVGSHRTLPTGEGVALEQFADQVRQAGVPLHELPVGPLDGEAAQQLAVECLGQQPESSRVDKIVRDAEGHPFFIAELAQAQARTESGELTLDQLLLERIRRLPGAARRVLSLLAVGSRPQPRSVVASAMGEGVSLAELLDGLVGGKLVRRDGSAQTGRLAIYHDRVRETLMGSLDEDARRGLHGTLAQALSQQQDPEPEPLANHLLLAGESERAATWFEHAAVRSVETFAFDHAALLYGRALELGAHDDRTRSFIGARHAETLALAGHPVASADAYEEAARGAAGTRRDELLLAAAEQLLFAGHNERALQLLRDTLPAYGLEVPATQGALVRSLIWGGLRLKWKKPRPDQFDVPSDVEHDLQGRRADLCGIFGDATLYMDFGLYAYFQTQHVLLGLASRDRGRVAKALTTRCMLEVSPNPRRYEAAQSDLAAAQGLAEATGDPNVIARVTLNRAVVCSAAARYRETLELSREAETIFRERCRGQTWGLRLSILWQSVSLFYLGDFAALRALCDAHLRDAEYRNDRNLSTLLRIWLAWCYLADDDRELALQVAPPCADPDATFTILDAGIMTMRAPMDLYGGEVDAPHAMFARNEAAAKRSGVLRARTRGYEVHWTRGLTAVHREGRGLGGKRQAASDARALRRAGTDDALAMAASLDAGLCLVRGDTATAADKLEEAACHFDAREMALWALTARLRRAQLAQTPEEAQALRTKLGERGVRATERWLQLWHPVPEAR